jgi:cytoskeletal protein CcmA (bactofilin family)
MTDTVTDLTTLIAPGTSLKGEITFTGPARISGRIEGILRAEDLLEITEEAVIDGEIHGTFIDIQGTVKGNIIATKSCRLNASARITGELRAATLAIAEGAAFSGKVFVGAESLEEATPAPAPVQAALVQPVALAPRPQESLAPHIRLPQQAPTQFAVESHTPATLLQSRLEQMAVEAEQVAVAAAQTNTQEAQVQINNAAVQNTLNRQPRIIKATR